MAVVSFLLGLIGSLGFLLCGMKFMSNGVQKSAGERLQRALGMVAGNRFAGLLTGLAITMIIQSSGATTVMVVSFVNAGLLSLAQSVGVTFGANIGTTVTAWIVSLFGFNFKISAFAIPVFGAGYFLTMMKNANSRNMGEAIMGFGMLFLGLSGLSDLFRIDPASLGWLQDIQHMGFVSYIVGFLIGIFITALMHSSSAFTAIVITLAFNKVVTWEMSAIMTYGSNIGSTIDAIIAAAGTTADAKRAALVHVLFNIFGTVLVVVFFRPLLNFVEWVSPKNNIAIQISILHTVFKSLTTAVCIPFVNQICALTRKIIKDDPDALPSTYKLEFVSHARDSYGGYIVRAEGEIAKMTDIVSEMFDRFQVGITTLDTKFIEDHMEVMKSEEDYCDQMQEQITAYLLKCETLPVSVTQLSNISSMIQIVDDLEAITDECYALGKLIQKSIEKKMEFKDEDMERLLPYVELARQFMQFIHININKHLSKEKLEFATELENSIDAFKNELKKLARKRLEEGSNVKAELLYMDLVKQIERIGDHCFNISELLAQAK
ncbi:Na/Pi cotransporter family protein [Treponema sp.]|uniref:Na/Pi cotransporter family protein n=1 Tax=Treponema sp. TaxID=166 RepID=UPI00298ECA3F|nr:Na/Pi cotransporter family protein [Treponema sp.]MCI7398480.1 Na/Pi cotransporter family protein [Spirochaetia bacterium]